MSEDAEKKPLSVLDITAQIERRLSEGSGLQNITVIGELIDYKLHPASGHAYFSLTDKDGGGPLKKKAVLKCTFFRGQNRLLNFTPKAGMEVAAMGGVSVYYQGGQYNFNVRKLIEVGKGNLWVKIQELKKQLVEEGVIDPEQRKPLPTLPRKVGLVTGMGTAAFRDIIKQINDRYPAVDIVIAPAMVQGNEAPGSIAAALTEIGKTKWGVDVILLARGGGSPEDLMAFNDEKVARAIYACPVPVVSAIGHQIDHPISDDVADVAAATPTDGAKLILPVIDEKMDQLDMLKRHLNNLMASRFTIINERLKRFSEKPFFQNPYVLIEEFALRLDEKETRMTQAIDQRLRNIRERFLALKDVSLIQEKNILAHRAHLDQINERVIAFSPLATLKRGYSMVYQDGKIVRSADKVKMDKQIEVKMHGGTVTASPQKLE
ncbi:MAG: exodeoxyribonuclease VII large subunit [Leptospirales bacterium]